MTFTSVPLTQAQPGSVWDETTIVTWWIILAIICFLTSLGEANACYRNQILLRNKVHIKRLNELCSENVYTELK